MQTVPAEEFVGDHVRVSVRRLPACQVEFLVTVTKKLLEKARAQALKSVNKEVTIPGFRAGKAPEGLILKKYAAEVDKRTPKEMADLAFVEAQKLAKVAPLNQNSRVSFDVKKKTEDGAEIVFIFEEEPKIPPVDPQLFVPKPFNRPEVGEKQVAEAIRQMAFFYAEWKPVEDRGVQEGDFIMIDLDTVDGDKVERVFNQVRFEVQPERMAAWMRDLTVGAKVGDVLEGMSSPDAGASEAEKAEFAPKKVRLHILKVERAIVPEMDDAFAQKVGAPTVAEMYVLIERILRDQIEEKAQSDLREQVSRFLVETYHFDLPRSLLEEEVKYRHSQSLKNPKVYEQWKNATQADKERMTEALIREATAALRMFYLARQVVADAKIPITHQEVQEQAVAMRSRQYREGGQTDQISKEEFSIALSALFLKKTQDFILQQKA